MNPVLDRPLRKRKTQTEVRLPSDRKVEMLRTSAEVVPAVSSVTATMAGKGWLEADMFETVLVLTEALINALKHGNREDPGKQVLLSYHVGFDQVLLEVEDEGPGFNPADVPDPTLPENVERSCGRGLFLMRFYSTWLRFNERGNRLTLCKIRKDSGS
jgi:serine/threonine-protein kinase RsbW